MASTRTVLRRGLSDLQGDFVRDGDGSVPTCSAQGGAAGITAIDALLSYFPDDYFVDWYFVLPQGPTGAGSYEVTRVVDFTGSTGTLTLEPDASAQIASAQPYELHRYSPATKHLALNAARITAIDALWLPVRDETLLVDNRLLNADAETYSATFTSWTHTVATWTQNTSIFRHGSNSFNGVAGGSAAQLTQDVISTPINIRELTGKSVIFKMWVYALAASAGRIRLSFDGLSTYTSSSYHTGKYQWELLKITTAVPSTATTVTAVLEVAAGLTARFDAGWLTIGKLNRYALPTTLHRRPASIWQQTSEYSLGDEADYAMLSNYNFPVAGRRLWVKGKGLLTEVTTETGTMEVSDPETQLLYAEALDWLIDHEMGGASSESQTRLERDKTRWQVTAARLRARGSVARVYTVQDPRDRNLCWGIDDEGETEVILLRNR